MTAAISWNWSDPANTDQALIKNLKFALISYAFEVVKVKQVKLKGDGSFYIQRSEWPGTKEIFFPELL